MRIGVVADTHGYFDPRLRDALAGVDAILHAGDVGSTAVLDELRAIAPLHSVRGNVDGVEFDLPPALKLDFGGLRIEMMHILPVPQSALEAWWGAALSLGKAPAPSVRFLDSFDNSTDVVIFGHSHQPCLVDLGKRIFFNPGSAGKKRFSLPRSYGLLDIEEGGEIEATIKLLDTNPRWVHGRLSLRVETTERK